MSVDGFAMYLPKHFGKLTERKEQKYERPSGAVERLFAGWGDFAHTGRFCFRFAGFIGLRPERVTTEPDRPEKPAFNIEDKVLPTKTNSQKSL